MSDVFIDYCCEYKSFIIFHIYVTADQQLDKEQNLFFKEQCKIDIILTCITFFFTKH